jgi:hypothetical protein
MEQTECSETSAYKIQTPGNYPEENIQQVIRGRTCEANVAVSLPWLRRLVVRLSPWSFGFDARPICMGFVEDKLAEGQAILRVLRFTY